MIKKIKTIFYALALLSTSLAFSEEKTKVILGFYNDAAPWSTIESFGKGLSFELANFLNQDKTSKYNFVSEFIPRNRINVMIAKKEPKDDLVVVAWVRPLFFGDKEDLKDTKYLWSPGIIKDSQYVISHKDKKVEYKDVSSLYGKNFSGVSGSVYAMLNDSIKDGKIKREDTTRFDQALQKVIFKKGNLDFAIIENSAYKFYKNIDKKSVPLDDTYISEKPIVNEYERRILIPAKEVDPKYSEIHKFLNEKLNNVENNAEWKEVLKKYGQI